MKKITNKSIIALADEYFDSTDISDWRISEAALKLNLTHDELVHFSESHDNYEALKYVKLKLESAYELRLNKRGNSGDVFALKCLGWTDKDIGETVSADRVSISELLGEKF